MATQIHEPETLPSMEEIQAVEDKIASARSDLDMFCCTLRRIDAARLEPIEVAAAMIVGGKPVRDLETPPPFAYDPETFSRLLVLAVDLRDDAEALSKDASKLQRLLLDVYRDRVLEPCPGDEATRGGDDA